MLLNLLMHQPQVIFSIVKQTPYWVWGLLAALVWLGASQLFDRTASLRRVTLMPLAMAGFSAYGLASAFGGAAQAVPALTAWAMAVVATTALALWLRPRAPAGSSYAANSRSLHLPGSAVPLALILGIFLTKYLVGVELAMQPAQAHDGAFAMQIAALYGAFSGLFAARALRLWRLVRSDAVPASAVAANA